MMTMKLLGILLCHVANQSSTGVWGWVAPTSPAKAHSLSRLSAAHNDNDNTLTKPQQTLQNPPSSSFVLDSFLKISECDNTNTPPSLNILMQSIHTLFDKNGSDLRGRFVDHPSIGSMASIAHAFKQASYMDDQPLIAPFTAYCVGTAFAQALVDGNNNSEQVTIVIGRDPRTHGLRLADALARGVESIPNCSAVFANLATTPGCAALCRMKCQGAVMVTASHLPMERNGFKFFSTNHPSGFPKSSIAALQSTTKATAIEWFERGIAPPFSGGNAVMCSQHVQWMPLYNQLLKQAIRNKTANEQFPLQGLKIVLNAGNGSGGFFHSLLADLGADMSASIHSEPDGTFPNGVPNPEDPAMLQATMDACQQAQADLGIMLDTDADRCGFVVRDKHTGEYEPLNRNRLIALLGVIFAEQSPGCAVVTDSVTSEGLSAFLQDTLGLQHVRYLKGYANVIEKARELTASGTCNAELAIETSGHCAMRENSYLDDGTYTAVQIVSFMARKRDQNLLDMIAALEELDEVAELRMKVQSFDLMDSVYESCLQTIEDRCGDSADGWEIDTENLEGIRVRLGNGQFFMLRKSLHDPILSVQIEAESKDNARQLVVDPLLALLASQELLDVSALQSY